jgi:hypothetical protein
MIDDEPLDTPEEQPERTVNAADPVGIAEQKRRSSREQREADDFWRGVLASEVGRREIWVLIQPAFSTTFACGPNGFPQTEATWFHAGEHAFAQRLYHSLQIIDHAGVLQVLLEHEPRFKDRNPNKRRSRRKDA